MGIQWIRKRTLRLNECDNHWKYCTYRMFKKVLFLLFASLLFLLFFFRFSFFVLSAFLLWVYSPCFFRVICSIPNRDIGLQILSIFSYMRHFHSELYTVCQARKRDESTIWNDTMCKKYYIFFSSFSLHYIWEEYIQPAHTNTLHIYEPIFFLLLLLFTMNECEQQRLRNRCYSSSGFYLILFFLTFPFACSPSSYIV